MAIELKHYNDGKEKWQSHEVYTDDPEIRGYGATKEEAYNDYRNTLGAYLRQLSDFYNNLNIDKTKAVDCFGKSSKL